MSKALKRQPLKKINLFLNIVIALLVITILFKLRDTIHLPPVFQKESPVPSAVWNEADLYRASAEDNRFLETLRSILIQGKDVEPGASTLKNLYEATSFPKSYHGFALAVYQPGQSRMLIVRSGHKPYENIRNAVNRVFVQQRYPNFDFADEDRCRIQIDFILNEPQPVEFKSLSQGGMGPNRFEVGVDGLRVTDGRTKHYFLPGDAFVESVLSKNHLWYATTRPYPGKTVKELAFHRFKTQSYISYKDHWIRLYRGYPQQGPLTKENIAEATARGIRYLVEHQKDDGRFLYYYDGAKDSFRDREHPKRDPVTNPYYNMLRHAGGGILLLYDYRLSKNKSLLPHVRAAIDFMIKQTVKYQLADGTEASYVFYNKKAKLGGSGIGLYLLSEYQHLTGDKTYEPHAKRIKNHLLSQILESGEFIYYYIYLDRKTAWEDNRKMFNFYYPGEAICGLATYYKYVANDPSEKALIRQKIEKAMHFLMVQRPTIYGSHYTTLPSDSWLMMGINEMWDSPELRNNSYRKFVFEDADKMVSLMYKPDDALYPDYVGALYYHYGNFPYADGARYEGLTAAHHLALKVGDKRREAKYRDALTLACWAALHLCNTPESVYSAPNPALTIGGIRFKHTRHWFRVDTIQHVAAFWLKFLPYLEE